MLHLAGFPHTRLDGGFDTCAYTQKVVKFRRMDIDRELVVYGGAGADVELLNEFERRALFGPDDPSVPPAWPTDDQWRVFNARAVAAIAERWQPGDLVLLAGGYSQRALMAALDYARCCEPFVGYEGIHAPFAAFESHAWRHHVYGLKGIRDGRWFDAVIPNYFDPADFPHLNAGGGDYLLFVGRMISRKGIRAASDIAAAAGLPLVFAGPGATVDDDGVISADGETIAGDDVTYIGPVDAAGRAQLMADARALLVPTRYIEPFGGVAVEAMMAGTPVIASDFGAFPETVSAGVSGFRFSTLAEAVDAVERTDELDPEEIRRYAHEHYSIAAIAPLFRRWFGRLETLDRAGWYELAEKHGVRG